MFAGHANSRNGDGWKDKKKPPPSTIAFASFMLFVSLLTLRYFTHLIFFPTLDLPDPASLIKPVPTQDTIKQCIQDNSIDQHIDGPYGEPDLKTCKETCSSMKREQPSPKMWNVCVDGCVKGTNRAFEIACENHVRDCRFCEAKFESDKICNNECKSYTQVAPKHLILKNCRESCEKGMKTGCHLGGSKLNSIVNEKWNLAKEALREENIVLQGESAKLGFWGTVFLYFFGLGGIAGTIYYVVQKYGLEAILDRVDRMKVKLIIFAEEQALPRFKKVMKVFKKKVQEISKGGASSKTEKVV